MKTKIVRWGNSLGLRVPKAFAQEAGFATGSAVEMVVRDGALVVRASKRRRYTLAALLAGVSARNRHAAVESGTAGREEL